MQGVMYGNTSMNQSTLKLGLIELHGPTASNKDCSIFEDLAAFFNCEFSSDAVDKLGSAWDRSSAKGRLDIDYESDYVSVHVSKAHLVDLAVLVNQLAGLVLEKKEIAAAKKEVKSWKRPEAFSWESGDVFYIQLSESLTTYGQVIGKYSDSGPTCLFLSYFSESPTDNINAILRSKPLAILHVSENHLDDQSWVVIGRKNPIANPDSGPCGKIGDVGSVQWNGFETLARAWHGLEPWNQYYVDDYLDKFLLSGVTKPKSAVMLGRSALERLGVQRAEWQVVT